MTKKRVLGSPATVFELRLMHRLRIISVNLNILEVACDCSQAVQQLHTLEYSIPYYKLQQSDFHLISDFKLKMVMMSRLRAILQASPCKSLWRGIQIPRSMPVRPCSLYTCTYKTRNRACEYAAALREGKAGCFPPVTCVGSTVFELRLMHRLRIISVNLNILEVACDCSQAVQQLHTLEYSIPYYKLQQSDFHLISVPSV
ncbi:Carbonic anhydrase 5B; mitochondrial [Camelus dromedarius]|uniref:Carbonic anhydrase 5B n=1 Tax=Camelus dromedarius TaxID=9838 RepID=A0A5N4C2M4_CAMDR|nr:Carbonic anhydrase 5B; mitochondrial [Camelus dromedarius]